MGSTRNGNDENGTGYTQVYRKREETLGGGRIEEGGTYPSLDFVSRKGHHCS